MVFYTEPGYKLKEKGASSLDELELLSIILEDKEKAKGLLEFVNLHEFSDCSFKELNTILNDKKKVLKVMALSELFKRYTKLSRKGFRRVIKSPSDVYDIMADEVHDKKQEVFYCLNLDNSNRVISKRIISIGILNAVLVHPREIFRDAIKDSANSVILAHNHPSGSLEPSDEDIKITEQLISAGEVLGIKVIDHVIIGDGWNSVV